YKFPKRLVPATTWGNLIIAFYCDENLDIFFSKLKGRLRYIKTKLAGLSIMSNSARITMLPTTQIYVLRCHSQKKSITDNKPFVLHLCFSFQHLTANRFIMLICIFLLYPLTINYNLIYQYII